MIRILALSDTHLGDYASLLNHTGEQDALFRAVRAAAENDRRVETVVLCGDIAERCIVPDPVCREQCRGFIRRMRAELDVGEIVYLPGNHDHNLLGGPEVMTTPRKLKLESPTDRGIARVFFEPGREWENFKIANPYYRHAGAHRDYLFFHGTYWRKDVSTPDVVRCFQRASVVLHHTISAPDCYDPQGCRSFSELETMVSPFVDSIWCNEWALGPDRHREGQRALIWFLLCNGKPQPPRGSRLRVFVNDCDQLRDRDGEGWNETVYDDDSPAIRRMLGYRPAFAGSLPDLKPGLTLVYGDTHQAAYGVTTHVLRDRDRMRVYNLGEWVSHQAVHHPPAYVFMLDERGRELFVEVAHDQAALDRAANDVAAFRKILNDEQATVYDRVARFKRTGSWGRDGRETVGTGPEGRPVNSSSVSPSPCAS